MLSSPPGRRPLPAVLWLVANVAGFGLAGALFHNFPLAFALAPSLAHLGSFSLMPALLGAVFGFAPGLGTGFLQYLILRRYLPLSRWWIISVAPGMALMHFLSDGFENARDLSLAVLLGGLLASAIQWLCLRPHWPASAGWILASGPGWYAGGLIGIAILHITGLLYLPWVAGLDLKTHGILGVTIGLTSGLSAGLLLRRACPVRWGPDQQQAVRSLMETRPSDRFMP